VVSLSVQTKLVVVCVCACMAVCVCACVCVCVCEIHTMSRHFVLRVVVVCGVCWGFPFVPLEHRSGVGIEQVQLQGYLVHSCFVGG
jgi:hypothetical protein